MQTTNMADYRAALARLADGRKVRMCIPPQPDDDDMLIAALIDEVLTLREIAVAAKRLLLAYTVEEGWEECRVSYNDVKMLHAALSRAGKDGQEVYVTGFTPRNEADAEAIEDITAAALRWLDKQDVTYNSPCPQCGGKRLQMLTRHSGNPHNAQCGDCWTRWNVEGGKYVDVVQREPRRFSPN